MTRGPLRSGMSPISSLFVGVVQLAHASAFMHCCPRIPHACSPAWRTAAASHLGLLRRGRVLVGARALSSSATSPRRKALGGKPPASLTPPNLLESTPQHLSVSDGFLDEELAASLRKVFDDRFGNTRSTLTERFVWDYWHVPGQYTLMRTAADDFFGEELYGRLCEALTDHGQKNLGCNSITQPWLSFYIDGCEQRMHTDSWHGPFAYVLSLTQWEGREFEGGETFILQPKVLDYWRGLDMSKGLEESTLIRDVEAKFNRLTVFDPRFPHGVRQVRGTRDPLKARIVLHGWFTDPGPFYTGGLAEEDATGPLNEAMEPLNVRLSNEASRVTGVLNVRVTVRGGDGTVSGVQAVADTLVPDPDDLVDGQTADDVRQELLEIVDDGMRGVLFPASDSGDDTYMTIPFVFE